MKPMLPSPADMPPRQAFEQFDDDWTWELKWDGVRCIVRVEDGVATLMNRNGTDITARYFDVAGQFERGYPNGRWVFDGEIVAFEDGKPSFPLLQRRDRLTNLEKIAAAAETIPVTFLMFDCLEHDGANVRPLLLEARRVLLEEAFKELPLDTELRLGLQFPRPERVWEFVEDLGLEGLVAKHRFSVYVPGRSSMWIKVKRNLESSFIVTNYQDGKGKHEGKVGALYISAFRNGKLCTFGKVGTGLTDVQREEIRNHMASGGPPLIVDVEYLEVTKEGSLRFPSFKGVRSDLAPEDCIIA